MVLRKVGPGPWCLYDPLDSRLEQHRVVLAIIWSVASHVVRYVVFGPGTIRGVGVVNPLPYSVGRTLVFAHVVILTPEQGREEIGGRAGHMVRSGLRHLWE